MEKNVTVINTGVATKPGEPLSTTLLEIAKLMEAFKDAAPAHIKSTGFAELVAWIEADPKGRYQSLMNLMAAFFTNRPIALVHMMTTVEEATKEGIKQGCGKDPGRAH